MAWQKVSKPNRDSVQDDSGDLRRFLHPHRMDDLALSVLLFMSHLFSSISAAFFHAGAAEAGVAFAAWGRRQRQMCGLGSD